jgi:hypothetical protein
VTERHITEGRDSPAANLNDLETAVTKAGTRHLGHIDKQNAIGTCNMAFVNDSGGVPAPGYAFLSYVREDRHRADRLQAILEAAGIRVWRDTSDLWPGTDWKLHIKDAITNGSFAFLACFSEHSASRSRSYQNEELVLAVEQMRLRAPGVAWLLPVRFANCDIPPFDLGANRTLDSLQFIDLYGDQWERGASRLVGAVTRILAAQQVENLSGRGSNVSAEQLRYPTGTRMSPYGHNAADYMRTPAQNPASAATNPVPPINDVRERQMLVAQLRCLGKFKPGFSWHSDDHSYEKRSVDLVLEGMRTAAVQGMADLQAFVATTPQSFPVNSSGGYWSVSVSNFFHRVDSAMKEYSVESRKFRSWRMSGVRSEKGRTQRLVAERSRFLSQLKPDFSDARDRSGYDRGLVDQFMSDLRAVSSGDVLGLQAFVATSPGTFPETADGYWTVSVSNFMHRLHKAMDEYVSAVSEVI